MKNLIGQTFGQYQIIQKIGRGGMATVYKARQLHLDRDVAIKVLPPTYAKQPGFSERFQREAQAIASLNHPNILPVHDFGQEGEYLFIVTHYIEGARTLKEMMTTPLSLAQVTDLIEQIAAALDYAHRQDVVHQNLKPSNILLDGEWVLLTDFGLTTIADATNKLTDSVVKDETVTYMSPEQRRGGPVDHRTDIYALGYLLFEMLSPNVPKAVEGIILKALALTPDNRFASAGALAAAVKQAISEPTAEKDQAPSPETEELTVVRAPGRPAPSAPPPGGPSAPAPSPTRPTLPWIWTASLGVVAIIVALCLVGLIAARMSKIWPQTTPTTTPGVAAIELTAPLIAAPTPTATPVPPTHTLLPPTLSPTPTTKPLSPTPMTTPTPSLTPSHTPSATPTHTSLPPTPVSTPTPSGGRIAFKSKRDGNWDIYVMYADGSNQINLTNNPATDQDPTWSPDGSRLAFQSIRDGNSDIYVMNADGSNQRNLTNNSDNVGQPAWSPAGTHIAYEVFLDGHSDIYVMNADGSNQRNLTNHPAFDQNPTWSPDGSRIAFDTDRDGDFHQIYVMNADGSGQTSLTDYSTNWFPSWSPDGTRIVYQFNVEIFVMNADGSGPTRVGSKENYWKLDPDWSPDGTRIVFTRFDDTNQDGYVDNWQDTGDIYVMNIDGRDETRLTIDPATDESPCWGP